MKGGLSMTGLLTFVLLALFLTIFSTDVSLNDWRTKYRLG